MNDTTTNTNPDNAGKRDACTSQPIHVCSLAAWTNPVCLQAVFATLPEGVRIVGNGTLSHPLDVEFSGDYADTLDALKASEVRRTAAELKLAALLETVRNVRQAAHAARLSTVEDGRAMLAAIASDLVNAELAANAAEVKSALADALRAIRSETQKRQPSGSGKPGDYIAAYACDPRLRKFIVDTATDALGDDETLQQAKGDAK